jgi:hypothetical protein
MMEKYLYPTIKLMHFLRERGGKFPGGIKSLRYTHSIYRDKFTPKDRTPKDLEALKVTTLTADYELRDQIRSEIGDVDSVSIQMRNTLIVNLQKVYTYTSEV